MTAWNGRGGKMHTKTYLFHKSYPALFHFCLPDCLHGLLPGPFFLSYSDFVFIFPYFRFCAVRQLKMAISSASDRMLIYLIVSYYDTPLTNLSLITFAEMQHIQVISNQIYLQAQNIRKNAGDKQDVEQMGTTNTNRSVSRSRRQKDCSNNSPSKKKKM